MGEQGQRTILPKTNLQDDLLLRLPTDSRAGGTGNSSRPGILSTPQARSNIRSACLACRQRRSKCTGGLPCQRCESLGTKCTYDEGHDRRTRAIREKGRAELELHKKVLDGIFDAIRTGEDDNNLLALVRENAPLSTISAAIDGDVEPEYYTHASGQEDDDADTSGPEPDMQLPDFISTQTDQSDMETDDTNQPFPQDAVQASSSLSSGQFNFQLAASQSFEELLFPYMFQPLHGEISPILDQLSRFFIQFRDLESLVAERELLHDNISRPDDIKCELLFRLRQISDPSDIHMWASAVVNQYPELDIFFRLAWLVLLVRLMKWLIGMSKDHFEALPQIMRPTRMQIVIPHSPFIDLAPLPVLRDTLIEDPRDFGASFRASGVSVGWNQSLEAAVSPDLIRGGLTVSKAFQDHISQAAHYTFGKAILQDFPELKNHINVSDHDFIPPTQYYSPFAQQDIIQ